MARRSIARVEPACEAVVSFSRGDAELVARVVAQRKLAGFDVAGLADWILFHARRDAQAFAVAEEMRVAEQKRIFDRLAERRAAEVAQVAEKVGKSLAKRPARRRSPAPAAPPESAKPKRVRDPATGRFARAQ